MIVINIDTEIKYIILTNNLRLYDRDREITLRIKITDVITEVLA